MTASTTPAAPADPPADATPEQIEAHIDATRERLASSVDALAAKLDVKTQARQKAQEASARVKARARYTYDQAKTSPVLVGAAAAGIIGLAVVMILLRRRGNTG